MIDDPVVTKKIGSISLKMRASHKLPEYYESFDLYDRALPRISKKIKEVDNELFLIDIGANVGDTVLLISDQVDGNFLCIEGDEDYLPLLRENIKKITQSKVEIEESYCSESDGLANTIEVDRSYGTAKLLKKENTNSEKNVTSLKTLDTILHEHPAFLMSNLLKIDTDGFETEILRGASKFLKDGHALVFFEFTPSAYIENNNEPLDVFRILQRNGYKFALFYDNFGKPKEIVDISDEKSILSLVEKIDNKEIYYYDILAWKKTLDDKYRKIIDSELLAVLNHYEKKSKNLVFEPKLHSETELESTENIDASSLKSPEVIDNGEIDQLRQSLNNALVELNFVKTSNGWKILEIIRKVSARLFPLGSFRRKILIKAINYLRKLVSVVIRALRVMSRLPLKAKSKLSHVISKRKQLANGNKIVYIDHSYHVKTKSFSTGFLVDYLKENFDVKVIFDDSWLGKPYPDLTFIDESYAGVVFFQNIPSPEIVNALKNKNKIYFPMFDSLATKEPTFWQQYNDLKIVSFSKIAYNLFSSYGNRTMYIQYFPKPKPFNPGDDKKAFFWQRIGAININTAIALLKGSDVKIHLHRAVDPGHTYIAPTSEEIQMYGITFSDWFKTREIMWDFASKNGIYISPREMEGIGLSFIEAMAMGKVVIAADNPTMNEYIVHGKTGLLFNKDKVEPLVLSNLEMIHEQTYHYMVNGHENWLIERSKIIEFIKSSK